MSIVLLALLLLLVVHNLLNERRIREIERRLNRIAESTTPDQALRAPRSRS